MLPELETLMDQYVAVLSDLDTAEELLASDVSSRRDVRAAVLAILGNLRAHFTIEESSNGFLAAINREVPDSLEQTKAFREEHQHILHAASELEQLLEREMDEPTWRAEVSHGLGELVQSFVEHERREDEWLAALLPVRR